MDNEQLKSINFATRTAVEVVLNSVDFVPPQAAVAPGSMAHLRAEMARFSDSEDHPERRAALEQTVGSIAGYPYAKDAERRTRALLSPLKVDAIADLGLIVPTEVLATALLSAMGWTSEPDLQAIRRDVLAVAKVIGRQEAAGGEANEAVDRLMELFATHDAGPVAPISLLYQNHDATAALLASSIFAHHIGESRRSSLSSTSRVAIRGTVVEGVEVANNALIVLDLEAVGLEFGTGPHHCPGREIGEQIVAGIEAAITAEDYVVVADEIGFREDGRAERLPVAAAQ